MNTLALRFLAICGGIVTAAAFNLACTPEETKVADGGASVAVSTSDAAKDIFSWYDSYKEIYKKGDPGPILAKWHRTYASEVPNPKGQGPLQLDRAAAEKFLREQIATPRGTTYYVESIIENGSSIQARGYVGGALTMPPVRRNGKPSGMSFFGRFDDTWSKEGSVWLLTKHLYKSGGWDPFVKGDQDRVKGIHEATRKKLGL